MPPVYDRRLLEVLQRIDNASRDAARPVPRLLAVSKRHSATAVADLALAWAGSGLLLPVSLGENYVQEAVAKRAELNGHDGLPDQEWHLIGHLQANKAREAATAFDWVQTVDRARLVDALARHRPAGGQPLNVLLQVNVDAEAGKHGCAPEAIPALAEAVSGKPTLRLRGLMAIPTPHEEIERRRPAFAQLHRLFTDLQARYPGVDTLSMGMSDDLEVAIAEGATMVRVGTALFGART
ncbi:YggS family pyridoxal phosphate-dependent enzyme [Lysobacter sp. A3-1-A15]|uniref:YggS family pyridoxal phosphate-dependent enzyme n=1 Tax=Novilysobacter viscosus TaxID=3098602 RepID=UPI003983AA99